MTDPIIINTTVEVIQSIGFLIIEIGSDFLLIWYNIADENGFNTIWRYFGWANQTLSIFTLWAITVYLAKNKGKLWYMIAEIPAIFMTVVCLTYILTQKIGFGLPIWAGLSISVIIALSLDLLLYTKVRKKN